MYTQTFLVTSVRGRVFAPQTAASESLSFFGAKMPLPAFFMAAAIFPRARFSAVIFLSVAFVIVVFVVFGTVVFATVVFATVVLATVLVVVVIAIEGRKCKHALSLEP